ncbi:MerR family transcriptional regulator [Bdellovibrio svalbardensis]|uniref:MerR family transcriptional regulator n=1 Tax=Bdellovibrio svalbardensis TaxID=2972972 RepID=A0ABT6DKK2_9BACT|nr:MerR family transcriptional regulator [Bdellovibrio svalbardensis]MDG0817388.1 MerR family transcriptional regulator [Bdellovibrio svalbardensis]
MTTTMTTVMMNNSMDSAMDSLGEVQTADLNASQEVVEEQMSFDNSELSLGDQHLEFIEETAEEATVVAVSSVSIPAMLCDEKLLEEIQAIPNKMGFKIGDVAEILGIKQYVLRYWETEFDVLRPKKASNNQRMYTRKDVENALLIRKLLHRDRFSIEGARNAMKELKAHVRKEKDMTQVYSKINNLNDAVEDLILDIRRVRNLFI